MEKKKQGESAHAKTMTALGDACTSAAVACEALERARKGMRDAGLNTAAMDVLLDDARRIASGLGDVYVTRMEGT